jgi:hypothetical protein
VFGMLVRMLLVVKELEIALLSSVKQRNDVRCNCFLFELWRILCYYSLHILSSRDVLEVPPKYFLSRYDELIPLANEIVELGWN